ncbi:MAG: DUF2849 domain-containing protein [Pseudomonadota bacterium]
MSSVRPKLSPDTPKIVTAWNARTGRTIYRDAAGDWSEDISAADVLVGEAADAALAAANADQTRANDPYLTEVSDEGEIAGREILRETIRATGPTVHRHFGKQAGNV